MDLVSAVKAACQLFKKPPLDPSLARPFHDCLHVAQITERSGLVELSISALAIGSKMLVDEECRVTCFDQIRMRSWLSLICGRPPTCNSIEQRLIGSLAVICTAYCCGRT
jgi:hypothetical protein